MKEYGMQNSTVGIQQPTRQAEITEAMAILETRLGDISTNLNKLNERVTLVTNPKILAPQVSNGLKQKAYETPLAQTLQNYIETADVINEKLMRLIDCIEL